MTGALLVAALAGYAVASVLLGSSFARGDRLPPRSVGALLAVVLAVHVGALAAFAGRWGELPLVGLGPSLSTLAFLVGLGSLLASTLGHAGTVGLVLVPVAGVLTAVAVAVGVVPGAEPMVFRGGWFVVHVMAAFVGLVGLTVAFAAGLMYLLQFRELKSKHFGAIFRFFPPLETLDRLGRQGLVVGFPFLTLAILAGAAWAVRFEGSLTPWMLKLCWVVLSWVVFLIALLVRTGRGRRGYRGALASVVGFVVVVLVYVVLRAQAAHVGAFL